MSFGDNDSDDRAYCKANNIHYCEVGNPYVGPGRAYHPEASEVSGSQRDGYPGGDTVRSKCPVCGTSWTSELPQ